MSVPDLTHDKEWIGGIVPGQRRIASGLALALGAAFTFGIGGPFAKSLLEAGWTSIAVVLARCVGTLLVLAVPTLVSLRGRWSTCLRSLPLMVAFGTFAVGGCQLCYYTAITLMPVGAALLIQYCAPVLLVLVTWAFTRRRPGALVLGGCIVAIAGLLLVVDIAGGVPIDPRGPMLALIAAVGVVVYYVIADRIDPQLPQVAMIASGMLVGTIVLGGLALTGAIPFRFVLTDVELLGNTVPWWLPLGIVVGISTLTAYLLGVAATPRLGSRLASFVGLFEVLFAVLAAWVLLGDLPRPVQLAGGVLIVTGIVLVKLQPEAPAVAVDPLPEGLHVPRRRNPFRRPAEGASEAVRSRS